MIIETTIAIMIKQAVKSKSWTIQKVFNSFTISIKNKKYLIISKKTQPKVESHKIPILVLARLLHILRAKIIVEIMTKTSAMVIERTMRSKSQTIWEVLSICTITIINKKFFIFKVKSYKTSILVILCVGVLQDPYIC